MKTHNRQGQQSVPKCQINAWLRGQGNWLHRTCTTNEGRDGPWCANNGKTESVTNTGTTCKRRPADFAVVVYLEVLAIAQSEMTPITDLRDVAGARFT